MVDVSTEGSSRLPVEASGVRKPPVPPLRVGLAMQDGEDQLPKLIMTARLAEALKQHQKKMQKRLPPDGEETSEV